LFEFCSDELKQSLLQGRTLETQNRAKEDEAKLDGKTGTEDGQEEEKKQEGAAAAGGDV